MLKATRSDKAIVVEILAQSFAENKSINYIIPQDAKRMRRIEKLIAYSFEICSRFGEVYLNEEKTAAALLLFPDKKKTSIQTILLDIKFIVSAIGIGNVKKAMQREACIAKVHPRGLLAYLWFIGVKIEEQGKGKGTKLLNQIINSNGNRIICLETSVLKNLPWYQKHGFNIYKELDFGYKLYCLQRKPL